MKTMPDKAEIALEFADKCDVGNFPDSARFEVRADESGVLLTLEQDTDADTCRSARIHLGFALIADTLHELARTVCCAPLGDVDQRKALANAAEALHRTFSSANVPSRLADPAHSAAEMTPFEEVRLLHILE